MNMKQEIMITFDEIKKNKVVKTLIRKSDLYLSSLRYTSHGLEHVNEVVKRSKCLAEEIGFSNDDIEIVEIASYLHDIGNFMGRENHQTNGALISYSILRELNVDIGIIADITTAISNHDESNSIVTNKYTAVLILADKSHVHLSRVRSKNRINFDIHDKVNYAVKESKLRVDKENTEIWLDLIIDNSVSQVMDYFEIFINRMLLCKKAAKTLKYNFRLKINNAILY